VGGHKRARGGAGDKQMRSRSAWTWSVGPMQVWGLGGGARPRGGGGCMAKGSVG